MYSDLSYSALRAQANSLELRGSQEPKGHLWCLRQHVSKRDILVIGTHRKDRITLLNLPCRLYTNSHFPPFPRSIEHLSDQRQGFQNSISKPSYFRAHASLQKRPFCAAPCLNTWFLKESIDCFLFDVRDSSRDELCGSNLRFDKNSSKYVSLIAFGKKSRSTWSFWCDTRGLVFRVSNDTSARLIIQVFFW